MNNAVLESELSRAYDKMELLREETARLKERVRVLREFIKNISEWRKNADYYDKDMGYPPRSYCDDIKRIEACAERMLACDAERARARSALHTTPEVV